MRHPARGPIGTMGIDGKPIGAGRRQHRGAIGYTSTEPAE
jgi:hypothetical protein